VLAPEDYPPYGGLGSYGIRGVKGVEDSAMLPLTSSYGFAGGRIYNLEASDVIKNGSGASGAHSDIAHPEVAHAFWEAAAVSTKLGSQSDRRGGLLDAEGVLIASAKDSVLISRLADTVERLHAPLHDPPTPGPGRKPAAGRQPVLKKGAKKRSATKRRTAKKAAVRGEAGRKPAKKTVPSQRSEELQPARRWINAEVEGRARSEPLVKGIKYVLTFDVDVEQRADAAGAARFDDNQVFAPEEDTATLTVLLTSSDFTIDTLSDSLAVPREGKSIANASFNISALHDGPSAIKATIHLKGNFIQQMDLSFSIGATGPSKIEVASLGRPLAAVAVAQPRDLGLSIQPRDNGYDVIVWVGVQAQARLSIQPAELAKAVDVARDELMQVVLQRADDKYIFQAGISVPDAERNKALKTMARAGATLFRKLFFGPAMGADANRIGNFLRKIATDSPKLKLQILANSAPIPWGMLYLGDASEGAGLDWSNFLGMRHIIEMIPLGNTEAVSAAVIPSDQPALAVSLNLNRGIDQQMGINLVGQQESYWRAVRKLGGVKVIQRATRAELVKALASGTADDQILYFYCHAKSADLAAPGGPDSACLILSDGSVTLGDLNLDAPVAAQLRHSPLVFINACESAELSPAFYDGFVPYFMAKGARGVIGTECKTPALFAAEWAKRFFGVFLEGITLGEAFLALRKEFLEQHGNPLGLLYAVHSDGDTRVAPPLVLAS
jgi:hypothetical protein